MAGFLVLPFLLSTASSQAAKTNKQGPPATQPAAPPAGSGERLPAKHEEHEKPQPIHWGDVATWVGSLGSLGALIAATIAAIQAKKLYMLELVRDDRADRDRQSQLAEERRRQASRVSVWVVWRQQMARSSSNIPVICARNASDLPVYAVRLTLQKSDGTVVTTEDLSVLPPANDPQELPQLPAPGVGSVVSQPLLVSTTFRDAAGIVWSRDTLGVLTELHTQSPTVT